jgi:hypothetical protein
VAADWILVPCLTQLRTEFNRIAPNRDKTSDGSIGDPAHQNTNSDHNADEESDALRDHDADDKNEVHAIDVDIDLRVPGLSMEEVVQFTLRRCRSGAEKRLKYIIYNRRIWSASSGWIQKPYNGSNAHDKHAHFSASYETAREASTASWHLEDLVAVTDEEIEKIADRVEQKVWNHTEPNPYDNGTTNRRMGGDLRMMEYRDDQRAIATNVTRLDNQVIPMVKETLALVKVQGANFIQFASEEVARDVQEAARDAGMVEMMKQMLAIMQAGLGSSVLSPEQFDTLVTTVAEKVAEAGTDAADQALEKLNRVAQALDNAGEALAKANDEPQPQQ